MSRKAIYWIAGLGVAALVLWEGAKTVSSIQYRDIIRDLRARKFPEVEEELVLAIIETESTFDPKASRFEEFNPNTDQDDDFSIGLMQVLSKTSEWLGYDGRFEVLEDPAYNIEVGMAYLAWLKKQFPGNLEGVVMGYNEGAGNYKKGKRVWTYYSRVTARMVKWAALLKTEDLNAAG